MRTRNCQVKNCQLGLGIMLLLGVLSSCGLPLIQIQDGLNFPDFSDQARSPIGVVQGTLSFADTKVGEALIQPVRLQNTGLGSLQITNAIVVGEHFDFAERRMPDLPISLEPGQETIIFVAFMPTSNGNQRGRLVVSSPLRDHFVELVGNGMWQLTLSLNNPANGSILAPFAINAEAPESQTLLTVTGIVELVAEPKLLGKFANWEVIGSPQAPPEFADILSANTTVILKDHTSIEAKFLNPWVYFPADNTSLAGAVTAVTLDDTKQGVVVAPGTHVIGENVTVPGGVSIVGGYNTVYSERSYQTVANRADPLFSAVLVFGQDKGITLGAGDGIIVEGLTFTGNASSTNALVTISGESTALLQYNTIGSGSVAPALLISGGQGRVVYNQINGASHGGNQSVAVKVEKSSPLIQGNEINGGTASADYARTYGLWVYDQARPVVVWQYNSGR
jgi:hypothetical protein